MQQKSFRAIIIILIVAIAVFFVALSILVGIYIGSNRNSNVNKDIAEQSSSITTSNVIETTTTTEETTTTTVTAVTTIAETTTETICMTTAPKLASITSAEIVGVSNDYGGGFMYKLNITGDFAYWTASASETSVGSGARTFTFSSDEITPNNPYFTGGSTLTDVRATITPYDANGIAGTPYSVIWNSNRTEHDSSVLIQSCNKTGIIRTYGEIVPGFASSYICEGGAMAKIRTELGDGWHIRSGRYCFSKNTTWYELYDDWDGDYYGWVSENYLLWN